MLSYAESWAQKKTGSSLTIIACETNQDVPLYATEWDGGEGGYVYKTNWYYYKGGTKEYVTGKAIRDMMNDYGGVDIRSHSFEVTAYDAETDLLTLKTKGYGHGVGMSQYGAIGYANEAGWTYDQILRHYYSITSSSAHQLVAPKW